MPTANLKFKIRNLKFHQGFTLIELLVVISIIAILLAVATVSFTNAQQKGRDNKRKSDLKAVQQALELYFSQNGKYPASGSGGTVGQIKCFTGSGTPPSGDNTVIGWGGIFSCDPDGTAGSLTSITYMSPLPKDPTNAPPYYYESSSPYNTYKLYAKLENVNDGDLANAPSSCNTSAPSGYVVTGSSNFCVINP